MLDTIIIEEGSLFGWFFTAKNGHVLKKSDANARIENIIKRFTKVAKSYDRNADMNAAVVWNDDGTTCEFVRQLDLFQLLDNLPRQNMIIQNFVQPKGQLEKEHLANFILEYKLTRDGRRNIKCTKVSVGMQHIPSHDLSLNKAAEDATTSLVSVIERSRRCRVAIMTCLFVVDDNGNAFLCQTTSCEILPSRKKAEGEMSDEEVENGTIYTGPSAMTQRVIRREQRKSVLVPEEDRIAEILGDSGRKKVLRNDFEIDSSERSRSKASRASRRSVVATHLGSSQKKGCSGDYCTLKLEMQTDEPDDPFAVARATLSRKEMKNLLRKMTSSSYKYEATPDPDLENHLQKPPSVARHNIPFKYIAQARSETELVDLFVRRHSSGESGDYLTEEFISTNGVAENFPGHYYKDVKVCDNCYHLYYMIEEARSKSIKKFTLRKSNAVKYEKSLRQRSLSVVKPGGLLMDSPFPQDNAMQMWKYAVSCLQDITKSDLAEFRSFISPPPAVIMVATVLSEILFRSKMDWKETRKATAQGDKFLQSLVNLRVESLALSQIEGVYPYIKNPIFAPEHVSPVCLSAGKLVKWLLAVLCTYGWQYSSSIPDTVMAKFIQSLVSIDSVIVPTFADKMRAEISRGEQFQVIAEDPSLPMSPAAMHGFRPATGFQPSTEETIPSPKRMTKQEREARVAMQRNEMSRLAMPAGQRLEQDSTESAGSAGVSFLCRDKETKLPYRIVGQSDFQSLKPNLVVFHDFFDTCDSTQILFRSIAAKHMGSRTLLFNYPGQAGSTYPMEKNIVLNNEWIAERVHELMQHLNSTGEFASAGLPFHIIGFGNGANIATCFATKYEELYKRDLRSIVLFNGFATVDPQLAAILHSSVKVFSCFPPNRPDLPVSYFTKFIFSDAYLKTVDPNLALNIYTAVTNPISLQGRIALCNGALHHVNLKLDGLKTPLILLQSTENTLIHPSNADVFLTGRQCTHVWSHQQSKTTGLSDASKMHVKDALESKEKAAHVLWLRTGHEVRQESKPHVVELIEYLIAIDFKKLQQKKIKVATIANTAKTISFEEIPAKTKTTSFEEIPVKTKTNSFEEVPAKTKTNSFEEIPVAPLPSGYKMPSEEPIYDLEKTEKEFQDAMEAHEEQKKKDAELRKQEALVLPHPIRDDVVSSPELPVRRALDLPTQHIVPSVDVTEKVAQVKIKLEKETMQHEDEMTAKLKHNIDIVDNKLDEFRREQEDRRTEWEKEDDARLAALEDELYGVNEARREVREALEDKVAQEEEALVLPRFSRVENDEAVLPQTTVEPSLPPPSSAATSISTTESLDLFQIGGHRVKEKKAEEEEAKPEPLNQYEYKRVKNEMENAHIERVKARDAVSLAERKKIQNQKAVLIQAIVRGFIDRQVVAKKREILAQKHREDQAGAVLTRVGRGMLGRKRAHTAKRMKLQHAEYTKASLNIQRTFRGHVVRREYLRRLHNKNATTIQRVMRGFLGRRRVKRMLDELEGMKSVHEKATKIQAAWKMKLARDQFLETRVYQLAALEIQRVYRGHVVRKGVRRKRQWQTAEPGPERLALGLSMIEESKEAFEQQQNEIDALHRAQEQAERRVGQIHVELKESEKELSVLEQELQDIDQIEADLQNLTNEAEMLHSQGPTDSNVPIGSGIVPEEGHTANAYSFESKEEARARQAEKYAVEMAIHLKRAEREKKKRELEAEFSSVFTEVEKKRTALAQLESKISDMEATRMRKDREFARLQRNLMELIDEQKYELDMVREKGIELETAVSTSAAAAAATAAKQKENQKRSQAMYESTEELMKFQFMSMSLTYFSSLNMVRTLRDLDEDTSKQAVAGAASTAAAAAAAAAAANIPSMQKLRYGGAEMMDAASKRKKIELNEKRKQEEEAKAMLNAPFPEELRDWTVDDVGRWLDTLSLSQYKAAFIEAAVDGDFLIDLRPEDMSEVLGMSHKLHVRKVIVSRNKLLPLDQQETIQRDAVLHEESSGNAREAAESGIPDADTVFSQARNGRLKRLKASIEAGFDVNTEDEKGNTLLLIACQNVNRAMAEMLMMKNANINHQNAGGNTALHFAMAYDTEGTLGEYLIERGADDTLENTGGLSPYDGLSAD